MAVISACTIVKNESANMKQWLNGVSDFADEIIVVDTGSEDDTVALAANGGAKIFHFEWIGDFSAAKNFAIDQAKGDWIVFLDADEYFPPAEVKKVRPLIERYQPHFEVAGLMMRMDNVDKYSRQNLGTSFYQIRVFRRVPWLRYEGHIHEQLKNFRQGRKAKMEFVPDIVIYHTGYSQSLARQKAERNLKMILENQAKFGLRPLDDFHLADCYYSLRNWAKAAEFAQKAIQNGVKAIGQENRPYAVLIQSLMFLQSNRQEIEQVIREAIAAFPEDAEFWMLWSMLAWDENDKQTAQKYMEKGLAIYEAARNKQGERLLANLCLNLLPLMYSRLGKLAQEKGDLDRTADYYLAALKFRPYDKDLLYALLHVWKNEETAAVIEALNKVYDREKDAAYLVQVLKNSPHPQAGLYYDKWACILSRREKYLLTGHVREAAADLLLEAERYARLAILLNENLPHRQQEMLGAIMPVGIRERLQSAEREGAEFQEILGRVADFGQQKWEERKKS